jgi:hypothetical protein
MLDFTLTGGIASAVAAIDFPLAVYPTDQRSIYVQSVGNLEF